MQAQRIELGSVGEATRALDGLGSSNSGFMATRAIHINILLRDVSGDQARALKASYNEVGAEAAVSHDVYTAQEGAVTDMIVMGTVYHHREVRRVLAANPLMRKWIEAIDAVVESAPQTQET